LTVQQKARFMAFLRELVFSKGSVVTPLIYTLF
jgi:hypothetical protein